MTVGASGLVFGYLTYLVTRGLFARKASYLLGGLVTLMLYGGVLWGLVPTPGVSWSGHLFGALGGILAAWVRPPAPARRSRDAIQAIAGTKSRNGSRQAGARSLMACLGSRPKGRMARAGQVTPFSM